METIWTEIGFVIWTLCALIFVWIGVGCLKAKEPVGFFTFAPAPKISEDKVGKYNRAVARLLFGFAAVFELLGIPVLLCGQNSPVFLLSILGAVFLVICMILAYLQIARRYDRDGKNNH